MFILLYSFFLTGLLQTMRSCRKPLLIYINYPDAQKLPFLVFCQRTTYNWGLRVLLR